MLTKPQTEAEPLLKAEEGVTKEDVPKTGRKTLHKLAGVLAFVGLFACGAAVVTGHAGSGLAPMSFEGGGRGATPRSWRQASVSGWGISGQLNAPRIKKDGSKACVDHSSTPSHSLAQIYKAQTHSDFTSPKFTPDSGARNDKCDDFMGSGESTPSDWSKRVKLENGNVKVCKNGYWQSANIPGKKAKAVTSSTDGTKIVAVTEDSRIWVYGCYDYYGACDAPGSACSGSSSSYSGGSSGGYHYYTGGSGYGR